MINERFDITMREVLIYLHIIYEGDFFKILRHIQDKESVDPKSVKIEVEGFLNEYDVITIVDNVYPNEFKRILNPPFVLIYNKGDDDYVGRF